MSTYLTWIAMTLNVVLLAIGFSAVALPDSVFLTLFWNPGGEPRCADDAACCTVSIP